jgi:hypothetical protein
VLIRIIDNLREEFGFVEPWVREAKPNQHTVQHDSDVAKRLKPCSPGVYSGSLAFYWRAVFNAGDILKRQIPRNAVGVIHDEPWATFSTLIIWGWQVRMIRRLDVVLIAAIEDQDKRDKWRCVQLLFKK